MNQYKGGKGADSEFYLSAWGNTPYAVDRKNLEEPIILARPFLSVIGGLPPDRLTELQGHNGEDGFIQRILFAWPQPVEVRWTDEVVSPEALAAYEAVVRALLAMDWQGEKPKALYLTDGAQCMFEIWHDEHCAEMERPDLLPGLRGFYSKLKGYCGRLALIHALTTNPKAEEVDEESVLAAMDQIDYFKAQAARVAKHLCRSVGVGTYGGKIEQCKEAIRGRSGDMDRVSKRDVQRTLSYDAEIFNPAWELFVYLS